MKVDQRAQDIINALDQLELYDIGVETHVDEPTVYITEHGRTTISYPCFQQDAIEWRYQEAWRYDETLIPEETKLEVRKRVRDNFKTTGLYNEIYAVRFQNVGKGFWDIVVILQ